ncbi:MAG: hypothetical protein H6708_20670 [Kofleriaceae bacterium]|nr:hypothetical protein [Kofleriaceae bacterium]
MTKVDAFDDSSPAAQVQLAGAFGDAEIAAHGGADQARTLRAQHHRWVDGWIERGDEACLELAAQLLTGADLVAACEHALDRHFKLAVSAIATLARHPDAPVSGRVRARATRLRTDALRPRAMPPIHGHRHRRSSERLAKPRRRSVARDRDTLPDRLN